MRCTRIDCIATMICYARSYSMMLNLVSSLSAFLPSCLHSFFHSSSLVPFLRPEGPNLRRGQHEETIPLRKHEACSKQMCPQTNFLDCECKVVKKQSDGKRTQSASCGSTAPQDSITPIQTETLWRNWHSKTSSSIQQPAVCEMGRPQRFDEVLHGCGIHLETRVKGRQKRFGCSAPPARFFLGDHLESEKAAEVGLPHVATNGIQSLEQLLRTERW